MNGLSLQSFDLNEAIFGKISGSQKVNGTHVAPRDSGSFERLLHKATGSQDEPREGRASEGRDAKTAGRVNEARPEVRGKECASRQSEEAACGQATTKTATREAPKTESVQREKIENEITKDIKESQNSEKYVKINNEISRDTKSQYGADIQVLAHTTGADLKIIVQGLPSELLSEVLAILNQQVQTLLGVPVEATDTGVLMQEVKLRSGIMPEDESDIMPEEGLAQIRLKMNVRVETAEPDFVTELQGLIATIAGLVESTETQVASVKIHLVQLAAAETASAEEVSTRELPLNDAWTRAMIQVKESIGVAERTPHKAPQGHVAFATLFSEDLVSQAAVDGMQEVDLSTFARLRVMVSPETILRQVAEEPVAAEQRGSNSGSSASFTEQGATTQSSLTSSVQTPDGSKAASFSTIIADRIAAITEQIAMREKHMDVLLRLQTESGESLLVNLKEQAGKILVNVRSGDERIITLLQSQKEAIVRHLEEKNVTASVSVSPIGSEDTPRRERREQPRHQWARQGKAFNPYVEASA